MHRNAQPARSEPHKTRTIRPARAEGAGLPRLSLEDLSQSLVVSPDDVALEIEDLAPHFLFEATQSSMPSSVPPDVEPAVARGPDAALREAFFEEGDHGGEKLREFERIWRHIISRELSSTEL
jgi:hypothetical protein